MWQEYRPRCRTVAGVHALPGGERYYEACLRWHTSLNITARQVHDIGLREVDNIRAKVRFIMREVHTDDILVICLLSKDCGIKYFLGVLA